MKNLLILLLSLSIFSCSQDKKGFSDYLKSLETLELPVKLDLNSKREASKNFDPTLFETYKHVQSDAPYGIAYKNEKTVGIIEYANR